MKSIRKILAGLAIGLVVAAAGLAPNVSEAGAASNFFVNKLLDATLRGQAAYTPATTYLAIATSTGSSAACGTEATYTGYARVAVTSSLANWAGTQGAGTTSVSSGTSGQSSNNIVVTFGAPTSGPTVATSLCLFDAASGGNLIFQTALTTSKTINSGDSAPSVAISALSWTIN